MLRRYSSKYIRNIVYFRSFCDKTHEIEDPVISPTRTNTTAQLWKNRVRKDLLDEARKKTSENADPNMPSFLITKTPSESRVSVELNFASEPHLREQYKSWNKDSVRLGKVLEDLDAMAGNVAHAHADDNNPHTRPLHIVTACVDRIDLLRKFPLNIDLVVQGSVGYVGTSSMYINVFIAPKDRMNEKILTSAFMMVARDANTNKSAPVNRLNIETEEEKILWKEGEDAKQIKKRERAQSLLTNPPTPHELESLHQMHFSSNENNGKIVSVKDTALSSVTVTQPQERNTKDKIFGGYLMRKAYELGMATALKFFGAHSNPFLLAVDEISFHRPVEIGSIITFDASVVFTTELVVQLILKIILFH